MRPQACLYTIAYLPRERIEALLLDEFLPLTRELDAPEDLDSLFFVRYSDPRWQLRFRVFGRPEWVNGPLRERIGARMTELERQGTIEGHELARYERELERYGGEEGMALAERLFDLDSRMALELLDLDRRGGIAKSRREVALLMADRYADLAGFDQGTRRRYYRRGYSWALEEGQWGAADLEVLERKFRELEPGLERLFGEETSEAARWGGEAVAAIAARFTTAAAPVMKAIVEAQSAGRIRQDLVYLLWSYAHLSSNRMGVESTPEAILRFFMHRLFEERRPVPA